MLFKLKQFPQYFEFYSPVNIPVNKECFLLGDAHLNVIEQQWLAYSKGKNEKTWPHPNALMDYIPFVITSADKENFHITALLDRSTRFHTVDRKLPKTYFRIGFLPFTSEKRPFVIVDQQWFDLLRQDK